MNQILVSEKVYVTPRLKRKKMFYRFLFIFSILAVFILTTYYVYSVYDKRKEESKSQDILDNIDSITAEMDSAQEEKEEILVVALNEKVEEVVEEENTTNPSNTNNANVARNNTKQQGERFGTIYTTQKGTTYKVDSILTIPSLGIKYPVLSECTTELLKIALNKFWGGNPNEVGNYCIVGHNYDGKDIFFGKLNRIQNGDIVEIEDESGRKIQYKVYNKFIVDPTDVACTSQLTNGKKETTLITCSDGGKTRLVVKCREVE